MAYTPCKILQRHIPPCYRAILFGVVLERAARPLWGDFRIARDEVSGGGQQIVSSR
jgi:hypothetical protein